MKEINDEIKQTINLIQSDICAGLRDEMQKHLNGLLEIKRNELQQRLVERSWFEPVTHDQAPYKSVKLEGQVEAKPLTAEELEVGGWWCADTSENVIVKLESIGICIPKRWAAQPCGLILAARDMLRLEYRFHEGVKMREIEFSDGEFYWSEK